MEIFIAEQCKTLAESCIMGLIFGAGYDIIRVLYVLCGIASYSGGKDRKPTRKTGSTAFLLFMTGDLLYMLTVTAGASVFLYHANHGQFRLYLMLSAIGGFALYHYTVGRVVMQISEAIVRLIRWVVYHTMIRPAGWLFRIVRRGIRWMVRITWGNVLYLFRCCILLSRMRRRLRQLPAFVRFQP